MKNKKISFIIISIILFVFTASFMFASRTNVYEEKLLGVWLSDKLAEAISLQENGYLGIFDPEIYMGYEYDYEGSWSGDRMRLKIEIGDGVGEATFRYKFIRAFLINKDDASESKIKEVVKNTGADGYFDKGFIDLNGYYVIYVELMNDKGMPVKEEKVNEIKNKISNQVDIERVSNNKNNMEEFVLIEIVETTVDDFKQGDKGFMWRKANSEEEFLDSYY